MRSWVAAGNAARLVPRDVEPTTPDPPLQFGQQVPKQHLQQQPLDRCPSYCCCFCCRFRLGPNLPFFTELDLPINALLCTSTTTGRAEPRVGDANSDATSVDGGAAPRVVSPLMVVTPFRSSVDRRSRHWNFAGFLACPWLVCQNPHPFLKRHENPTVTTES
jgi:hypothetical protein